MRTTTTLALTAVLVGLFLTVAHAADVPRPTWKHLSSKTGDLPEPNGGKQQTACVVFDIDQDGVADVVIAERTQAPAIIWLRHTKTGWDKYVIDDTKQRPEAGGWPYDVDGDGDLDLIIGGDAGSDELWWYENPAPKFDPQAPWKQRIIKQGGGKAHHDHVVADFQGTGKPQLMFWNQGARKLFLAQIPGNPRTAGTWPLTEILDTSKVKTAIKQEGMAAFDVDGDGRVDLLAGIYWFKHRGGNDFQPIQIADHPGRIAAGHFKPGKVAQFVLGPGDGDGPLWLIECRGEPTDPQDWTRRPLLDRDALSGHTLAVADINADGNLDIFCAEMHTPGPKEKCTAWILYGDGRGRFQVQPLSVGIGNHDSRVADVVLVFFRLTWQHIEGSLNTAQDWEEKRSKNPEWPAFYLIPTCVPLLDKEDGIYVRMAPGLSQLRDQTKSIPRDSGLNDLAKAFGLSWMPPPTQMTRDQIDHEDSVGGPGAQGESWSRPPGQGDPLCIHESLILKGGESILVFDPDTRKDRAAQDYYNIAAEIDRRHSPVKSS